MAERYGISAGIIAYPGFRAGIGYEWEIDRSVWQFAIESGYTYIKGDNPLVLNVSIVPLVLKAGYVFRPIPNYSQFTLTPTMAMGMIFSSADHYKSVIDLLIGNLSHSRDTGFLIQPGVRAGWSPFPRLSDVLEIFFGISIDVITEIDGIIPLPQIELGILFHPFRIKHIPRRQKLEELTEEEIIEPVLEIQKHLVLFGGNSITLSREAAAQLDEIILSLSVYEEYSITIKGYSAPYVSQTGQMEVSRRRALNTASYLTETLGIPEDLISVEWHGAQSTPEDISASDHVRRRSAEIIIEGWKLPEIKTEPETEEDDEILKVDINEENIIEGWLL